MLLFIDFLSRLSQVNVITGIILCALGLGLALLSRKYEDTARKTATKNDDNICIALRIIGLIFICIALLIMILN